MASPIVGSFQAPIQSVALLTPYGLYKPDRLRKLFHKVPRASSLSWMMANGQHSKRTAHNFTYEFYEEGQFFKAAATIESATPNAVNPTWVDIVMEEVDHSNGGKNSYPIPTNTVLFKNGTVGFVQEINRTVNNAHVVTVSPATPAGNDVNAASVATQKIVFFSNAQTEDSEAPESRVPQVTREENYIQTFRETFRVTDHEESTELWFDIDGVPFLYVKGIEDAAERFEIQQELAFLVGKSFNSVNYQSKEVKATDGLIPTIRTKGTVVNYDKTTLTPDLDDIEELIGVADKNYGPRDYMMGNGLNIDLKLNRLLVNFLGSTQGGGLIDFSALKGGKEQALSLNLQWMSMSGRTFYLQRWDILSHEDSLGAEGLMHRYQSMLIPMGKVKNPNAQYASKNFEDYCQCVYIPPVGAPNEIRGHYKIFETGGNARSGATEARMRREIHHVAYKGFEMRNKEKFILFEPEP